LGCSVEQVKAIFRAMHNAAVVNEQMLNELDSMIGDAEHGLNLKRGFTILMEKMDSFSSLDPAKFVKRMGTTLAGAGCGSGPIFYGLAIRAAGDVFIEKGMDTPDAVASALEAALAAVKEKGGAEPGGKTMVDALEPAVLAFREKAASGGGIRDGFEAACAAAEGGMKATADMVGKKGRGFHAGERGRGHQDPGATSCFHLLKAITGALEATCG